MSCVLLYFKVRYPGGNVRNKKIIIQLIIKRNMMYENIDCCFGITMTGFSMIALVIIILRKILFGDPVTGWASTICVINLIGGIQTFCMGIMEQYIAEIHLETKQCPHYIIS